MTLTFKVDKPENFTAKEKDIFVQLLINQEQVANPNIDKVNASPFICIVFCNDEAIGIGAIKNVYKNPFDYAEVPELKAKFKNELGYLFVSNDNANNFRGLGIGKTISKLLLKQIGTGTVFATTDVSRKNVMKYILKDVGFKKVGKTYKGQNTNKKIGLYIKTT